MRAFSTLNLAAYVFLTLSAALCSSAFGESQQVFGESIRSETRQAPPVRPPPSRDGSWLGWGADVYNNRWASSDAEINLSNIASLNQTCEIPFYPGGVSATPYVADNIAYFPTWSGLFVAVDYDACEIVWQTNVSQIIFDFAEPTAAAANLAAHVSRTTPAVDGHVIFIGTMLNALVVALDKRTGVLIDAIQLDTNPFAIVTMSPTFYDGLLYIGTSSTEEGAVADVPDYICCDFIGSMNGLALRHGRLSIVWTTPMISATTNFSGAAVWGSQPAIDSARSQLYIGTGNLYSIPIEYQICQNQTANISVIQAGNTTDPCRPSNVFQESVLALDLTTGRINWVHEFGPLDAWNLACTPHILPVLNPGACGTATPGPDADFGMAPTYIPGGSGTPYGLDIVVVGQKNGNLYALMAQTGRALWAVHTSPGGIEGGLTWGIAADYTAAYYTAVNSLRANWTLTNGSVVNNSVFGAVSLLDGQFLWETPAPNDKYSLVAPSVVNDLVLVGTGGSPIPNEFFIEPDGDFLALDKATGKIVRRVPQGAYFQGGIAAVKDKVLFGTGYDIFGAVLYNGSFTVWSLPSDTTVDTTTTTRTYLENSSHDIPAEVTLQLEL